MSVEYNGKEFKMKKKSGRLTLDLSWKKIKDITEIVDLEILTDVQSLKLNNNQIGEIKGLETLKNLIKLDLRGNQISEIKGLENLTRLEELYLQNNQIEVIKGLDNLVNLKSLNLFGNNISQVESVKNINNLQAFYLSGNPLYAMIQPIPGGSTTQKLEKYSRMSMEEKKKYLEEVRRKTSDSFHREFAEPTISIKKRNFKKKLTIILSIIGIIGLIMIITGLNLVFVAARSDQPVSSLGTTLAIIGAILFALPIGIFTRKCGRYCYY